MSNSPIFAIETPSSSKIKLAFRSNPILQHSHIKKKRSHLTFCTAGLLELVLGVSDPYFKQLRKRFVVL
jgi:hypothetical protein